MKRTIAALAILIGVGAALAACGPGPDAAATRNACLYDAVSAYPAWNPQDGSILTHTASCNTADLTQIRDTMDSFVAAANRNSEKELGK